MPVLTLTNEQVIELVKQLPVEQQMEIFRFLLLQNWEDWESLSSFRFLLLQNWEDWESLSSYGFGKARLVAQERGYNWDVMTEDEREAFIDEVVHED